MAYADSPQAKGGVRDSFGIVKERVAREMRVMAIKTKQQAKDLLREDLSLFNRQFSIPAANNPGAHLELPNYFSANKALCLRTESAVKNDHTIVLTAYLHQIKGHGTTKKVAVEKGMAGCFHIIRSQSEVQR